MTAYVMLLLLLLLLLLLPMMTMAMMYYITLHACCDRYNTHPPAAASLSLLSLSRVQGRGIAVCSSAVGLTLNALLITAIGNLQNSTEDERGVSLRHTRVALQQRAIPLTDALAEIQFPRVLPAPTRIFFSLFRF